jgi:hypothetical protein
MGNELKSLATKDTKKGTQRSPRGTATSCFSLGDLGAVLGDLGGESLQVMP